MLGGGAGTIDHMIKTLRNNKLLLKSRRGFYKVKMSYSEIRKFYRNYIGSPIARKNVDQKELQAIRSKLILQRKKSFIKTVSISILCIVIISIPTFLFLNHKILPESKASESFR